MCHRLLLLQAGVGTGVATLDGTAELDLLTPCLAWLGGSNQLRGGRRERERERGGGRGREGERERERDRAAQNAARQG